MRRALSILMTAGVFAGVFGVSWGVMAYMDDASDGVTADVKPLRTTVDSHFGDPPESPQRRRQRIAERRNALDAEEKDVREQAENFGGHISTDLISYARNDAPSDPSTIRYAILKGMPFNRLCLTQRIEGVVTHHVVLYRGPIMQEGASNLLEWIEGGCATAVKTMGKKIPADELPDILQSIMPDLTKASDTVSQARGHKEADSPDAEYASSTRPNRATGGR